MIYSLDQKKPVVWTIAGSDSGGGAGIQADLHTFQDFAVHGCSVITALTAQNSFALGYCVATERKSVVAQINALDSDMPAAAIKLGMLANAEIVETVIKYLDDYTGYVVCDPVMFTTTGGSLLDEEGSVLLRQMLPRIDLLTPNILEAETLTGLSIKSLDEVVVAAEAILAMGARSVVITGGHLDAQDGKRVDYWTDGKQAQWLSGEDIQTVNNHGTGCTFSSAIAAAIAHGYDVKDALVIAKAYVTQGLRHAIQLGNGPGPVGHFGWPDMLEDLPTITSTKPVAAPAAQFASCGEALGLYPVVDSADWVTKLAALGVTTIQLRVKDKTEDELRDEISRAIAACKAGNVRLFINDHWQLAIELGAYGVHLGQQDLDSADLTAIANAGLRLGVSTHSYYEIARAHGLRPSYIALGPVYETTTKAMDFAPLGLDQLEEWVDLLGGDYPLTAIGGISYERVNDVLWTGVSSCAMVTAITEADDYQAVVTDLVERMQLLPAQELVD